MSICLYLYIVDVSAYIPMHSFIHSFIRSFILSFIHPFMPPRNTYIYINKGRNTYIYIKDGFKSISICMYVCMYVCKSHVYILLVATWVSR